MSEIGKTLRDWAKRLMGPDEPTEPDTNLSEEEAKILEDGKNKAGSGIFEEENGYTPKDNSAIVFVDPKTLEDKDDNTPDKKGNTPERRSPALDDDTFERLEREEDELNDIERQGK